VENLSLTVKSIKTKLLALVKKHQQTLEQLEKEQKRVEELQQEIADLRSEMNELDDKNKILKIAGQSTEGGNREMKLKLNELVREVDKCIAQFNK
jgi:chromosome segregation ATPase